MIQVLLAEDHRMVREALRLVVNAQPDMQVVCEVGDGRAAIASVATLRPDVVVLDLSMPGLSGLSVARALKAAGATSALVALTRHDDEAYVHELLEAGAAGYILKQSPSDELVRAIRAAAAGSRYLDAALAPVTAAHDPGRRATTPRSTKREREVLRLVALGNSNKDIAAALGISVKTVEVHKASAMRKLGLRGRTDVVRYAVMSGWLDDHSSATAAGRDE